VTGLEGTMDTQSDDVMAIKALIARQFGSLCWTASSPADWGGFARDFLDCATLFPAARPAASQSVPAFVQRMKGLAATTMQSSHEAALGAEVIVFGNIAIAAPAVEIVENNAQVSRSVEMMLLVKTGG
jgi:hypothetical protein